MKELHSVSAIIEPLGGPFIVIPSDCLNYWTGTTGGVPRMVTDHTNDPTLDDYETACSISTHGSAGLLEKDHCRAVVTTSYNYGVSWIKMEDLPVPLVLVRVDVDEEDAISLACHAVDSSGWVNVTPGLTVISGRIVLMHAALPGREAKLKDWNESDVHPAFHGLAADVPEGIYKVDYLEVRSRDLLRVVLLKFALRRP